MEIFGLQLLFLLANPVKPSDPEYEYTLANGEMKKLSFTPPQLSEEEQHSAHMPEYLKCDGCLAVSFTLHRAFEDKHKNIKDQTWRMDDGDVMEIFGMIVL